jgi:hypothetical protein
MEIPDGQQFLEAVIDPGEASGGLTLGTVTIATGVITNDFMAAGIAVFYLSAQHGRSAGGNGVNDLAVKEREFIKGIVFLREEMTEDLSNGRSIHERPPLRWAQPLRRADARRR